MGKLSLVVILILIVFAATPASAKFREFVVNNKEEKQMRQLERNIEFINDQLENLDDIEIDQTTDLESGDTGPTPPLNTKTETKVVEEKIDKQDGSVKYEGSVKSEKIENSSSVSDDGNTSINNKNSFKSNTDLKITSDTGGNSGQNVTNGSSKVSVKITTDGEGTKVDIP